MAGCHPCCIVKGVGCGTAAARAIDKDKGCLRSCIRVTCITTEFVTLLHTHAGQCPIVEGVLCIPGCLNVPVSYDCAESEMQQCGIHRATWCKRDNLLASVPGASHLV